MEEFRAGEQPEQILGTDLVATFSWRAEKGQADHQEVLRGGRGRRTHSAHPLHPYWHFQPQPRHPKSPRLYKTQPAGPASVCYSHTTTICVCPLLVSGLRQGKG